MANRKNIKKKQTSKLDALLGIALTLPGLAAESHASKPMATTPKIGAFYGAYSEKRYTIDKHEASFLMPVSPDKEIEITTVMDTMTGASVAGYFPSYILPSSAAGERVGNSSTDPSHTLVEGVTKQSIVDKRRQIAAKVNYYIPDAVLSLDGGYSTENDFQSFFTNATSQWEFNKKNTVLEAGLGYAYNITNPAKKNTEYLYAQYSPNYSDNKGHSSTYKLHLGLNQLINKNFYAQQTAELTHDKGFLSDPYKAILYVGDNTLNWPDSTDLVDVKSGADRRPRKRTTGAFVTSLVHYVPRFESSLHFNYRIAFNSWQMTSHTFDLSYAQPLSYGWELVPKVRYYSQDEASFYALVYKTSASSALYPYAKDLRRNKASSDYRLSALGTIGFDVTLSKKFENSNLKVSATAGYAKTSPTYGFSKSKGPKNPTADYTRKFIAVQLTADLSEKAPMQKSRDQTTSRSGTMFKQGTVTLQPLSAVLTPLSLGKGKKDTKFMWDAQFPVHTMEQNMYKNQRSLGFGDGYRNGIGYRAELGYFVRDRLELFTDLGFSYEKGLDQATIIGPQAFKFKSRTTYNTGIGARYYFDTKSTITPYVGAVGGVEWQPRTKAAAYTYPFTDFTQFLVVGPKIGDFTIFKSQQLFNGSLFAGFTYLFKENIALNLQAGLQYHQQNKRRMITIGGNNYTISDNKNKFIVPLNISVKFSF